MLLVSPWKERETLLERIRPHALCEQKLRENATSAPAVNGLIVVPVFKKKLRRAVPSGNQQ